MMGLDKEIQSRFVGSNESYYHDLADLLISKGRLAEAQQVLDLLKEQEYKEYIRGAKAETLSPVALTPAETEAEADYRNTTAELVAETTRWTELKATASRTQGQEQEYEKLSDELQHANKGLNDYFGRLYVILGKTAEANRQISEVQDEASVLRRQIGGACRLVLGITSFVVLPLLL
jgi:hypothetical protein